MAEPSKVCKDCGAEKPLSQFYKHRKMADGHLNNCKGCKCSYAKDRYGEKSADPDWVESERRRAREKYHRLYATGRQWVWLDAPVEVKRSARAALGAAVRNGRITRATACEMCGDEEAKLEGHHQNYYEPLAVVWLCRKCHAGIHLTTPEGEIHGNLAGE